MHRIPIVFFTVLLVSFFQLSFAQETIPPTDREAIINVRQNGNTFQFEAELPPQIQIPGAPEAYYEHYWEFGDGNYSFEQSPEYTYPETGEYEVQLWATGKYDNGKSPRSRRKRVRTRRDSAQAMASISNELNVLPEEEAALGMKAVRNPRPEEEFVAILSYHNPDPITATGQIYLFYNEKKFPEPHFEFLEARTHHGEYETGAPTFGWNQGIVGPGSWAAIEDHPASWIATTSPLEDPRKWLSEARADFGNQKSWAFTNLAPGEKRNLFFSFQPTPEMAADTNVTLHIRALYVPDAGGAAAIYDLSLPIVASHDPNFIAVSDRRIGFRNIRSKKLDYEIHFQNNGKGPAKRIQITTGIPEGLAIDQLEVLENQPPCPICPDTPVEYGCMDTTLMEDKIVFTFNNIYLPGTKQEGLTDRDSTKGFVRYRIVPGKKIKKQTLRSQASIVFDQNEPIVTNFSNTRFKMGISPGPIVGYRILPNADNQNAFVAGLVIAPYKPHRPYFQVELLAGFTGRWSSEVNIPTDTLRTEMQVDGPAGFPITVRTDSIFQSVETQTRSLSTFQLVPLQLKYNLNDFIGVGLGADLTFIKEDIERNFEESFEVFEYQCIPPEPGEACDFELIGERSNSSQGGAKETVNRTRLGLFADVQVGLVRAGPSLGIRPHFQLGEDDPFSLFLYLSYKF